MTDAGNYHLLKSMAVPPSPSEAEVNARLDRIDDRFARKLDLDHRYRQMLENVMQDISDRLERIELALFPGLVKDLQNVRKLLGPDSGPAVNPLDLRDRRGIPD